MRREMRVVGSRSLFGKSLFLCVPKYALLMLGRHYFGNRFPLTCVCSNRGINEGRMAAREVDLYLEKNTNLPVTGGIVKRTAREILDRVAKA